MTSTPTPTNTRLSNDDRKRVTRADIRLDRPVHRSEGGLPIGNGRVGTLVWTTPSAVRMQINRVDVFPSNRQTNSFHFHEDYCGGCGFVDVDFGDEGDVFTPDATRQHLALYDATLTVAGSDVEVKALAWHERDVIALRIEDRRRHPLPICITLRMLREPVTVKVSHRAESTLESSGDRVLLRQSFFEDEHYCGSVVAVTATGCPSRIKQVHDREINLCLPAGNDPATVLISSAATFSRDEDIRSAAMADLDAAAKMGWDALAADNRRWWSEFWSKSFVELRSADGEAELVEQHYTYFLYVMACTSRGRFAPKFNGMLWCTGGDMRMWGAAYWWNNTCLIYRALPASNHLELMQPMFDTYSGMRPACEKAAREVWGTRGLYIPETVWFDGPEELPPEIAAEASDLMLFRKPWRERSDAFVRYAQTKNEFSCWWNWHERPNPCVKGWWRYNEREGAPAAYITHIFGSMARIAYTYWVRFEYGGEAAWLRDRAYPMLKGIAEFFRNFPNLRLEADGLYHIHKVNYSEGARGCRDSMECMAGMRRVFACAIRAAETLGIDGDLATEWRHVFERLAPLPTSRNPDAIFKGKPGEPECWVDALKPVLLGGGHRTFDPVTDFDLCTLETAETDPAMWRTAQDTYDLIYPVGVDTSTPVHEMSKQAFESARLGRAEDVQHMLVNQVRILSRDGFEAADQTGGDTALENRMTLREGVQALTAERLGNAASGLQEALCQSVAPSPAEPSVIRLFPAWPSGWDARFRLLCRGGFLVSASISGGQIGSIEILSQIGGECRVRNPWPSSAVTACCCGRELSLSGPLLSFPTSPGETWTLISKS